jgi:hypothetical protein
MADPDNKERLLKVPHRVVIEIQKDYAVQTFEEMKRVESFAYINACISAGERIMDYADESEMAKDYSNYKVIDGMRYIEVSTAVQCALVPISTMLGGKDDERTDDD